MVEHKDVVLGVLAASAALAGLALVFLGLVIGAFGTLDGAVPDETKAPYRRAGNAILVAFVLSLICVALCTSWLVWFSHSSMTYDATVATFGIQLVALVVVTVMTMGELLWD